MQDLPNFANQASSLLLMTKSMTVSKKRHKKIQQEKKWWIYYIGWSVILLVSGTQEVWIGLQFSICQGGIKHQLQKGHKRFQYFAEEKKLIFDLSRCWCVNSPLVIAPTKREGSKPRLFIFSKVIDERLEELLIITIFAPLMASFSTVTQWKNLTIISIISP